MKIAFIGQKGIPMKFGGVEKHVERLAIGLARKGHQVYVYTRPWYTHAKMKTHKGVHLISLPSIRTKHLDAITHTFLASLDVLKKDYDIVHYHGVGPSLLAWIPHLFKPRTKVVITFHCIDRQHQKWGALARLALRFGEIAAVKFGHDTITVSKTLQMYCADKYGAKTIYIPNGIDLLPAMPAKEIKKKFSLTKDSYLLFVSRLVKHKGAHYLIEAFNQIKTDKKLVIVGDSAFTDAYVKKIKGLAASNPNIIFTSMVRGGTRLWRELYSNAHLMIHPSESEGLPIVILEGMSFGLPILVSDIPENMEAIAGGHGFSFHSGNVKDLKQKLEHLLRSPKLLKQVGVGARKYVIKNYNWKDIVESVERVYRDLLVEGETECLYQKKRVWI
ncbi:glycosyltransferase family 4 protein [Candidatus Falkowbacteria bacterium]|nr:glycosyltransferase family 4 protein [Candidatus Falkowbacteria bacterium]